jgi:hypothetical protein
VTIKVEAFVDETARAFKYTNVFARERTSGPERLCIGIAEAQDRCVLILATTLAGPYKLLYLLHTTRTDAPLGRYEGPEMDHQEIEGFFHQFGRFLIEDARHDLWLHSRSENATIVLDRHNLIYAYGPLDSFERVLVNAGVRRGALPQVPDPHVHHYNAECDDSERAILLALPWRVTPLRESDIQ